MRELMLSVLGEQFNVFAPVGGGVRGDKRMNIENATKKETATA
jgi:hypothetical protein